MSLIRSTDEPVASDPGGGGLVRWRLDLSYDGTDFAGWAWQRGRDLRTVQGVLEAALATVLRQDERVRTVCSGRTDAGVHARGQVVHVDLAPSTWPIDAGPELVGRLNGVLGPDVRVRAACVAPAGFDARFSPLSRTYRYRLCDRPAVLDPLRRHEVVETKHALTVSAMNHAATVLLGEHDFAPFCRRREGASTVRRLLKCSFSRTADGLVVGTIEADAFCHSMVRAIVGALIAVGEGRQDVAWIAGLMVAGERSPAVQVAPAHGLTLEAVTFPEGAELAERAEAIRAAGARRVAVAPTVPEPPAT